MQYLPGDVAQWIGEEDAARRRQQQAQQLIQAGYNPVQGGNPLLAMLASVFSTVKGNKMAEAAEGKLSEIAAKRFDYENQQAQAQADAEQAAADLAYERDLEKIRKGEEYKAQFRGPAKIDPLSPEGMRATLELERAKIGMQPKAERAPSELERKIAWLEANGVGKDAIANMVMGGQSNAPSGYRQTSGGGLEAIPGGPADKPKETDPRAAVAHDALRFVAATTGTSLAELEKMTPDQVATHFEKNSSPIAGPWLGNLPGAGMTTNAILKEMAAKQARVNNPKGQVTDADFKAAEAGLPAINRLDSANAEIIRNMLMQAQGGQVAPQAQPQAPQAPAQGQPTQTATNPQTGQKIGLINGQWVPI